MGNTRIIAFFIAWTLATAASAGNFFFRKVDVKDGMADNFVRDVIRDSQGFIWLSTINGLSRYDGYRFHNYMPLQFGGRGNDVKMVRETADNTLWMLCAMELYCYDRQSKTWLKDGAKRLSKLGVKGKMTLFYVDDRHYLWVATDMGLFHYDFTQRTVFHIPNYSKAAISHIVSKNGRTVIVTKDYKIYEVSLNSRRLVPLSQAPNVNDDRDNRVFLDSHATLWMFNSHSQAGTQWQFSLKSHEWRQAEELSNMGSVLVNAMEEDNEGRLWLGTVNAGIHVFEYQQGGMSLKEVMSMHAFESHSSHITCFYLDNNNTMWVGSAKLGVAFTDMSSPNFNLVSTGAYEDVSSMVQDEKGNIWIGFDGAGVLMKSPEGVETHFNAMRKQIPSDIVTSLVINASGELLVGTYGNGIAKFEMGGFQPVLSQYPQLRYVKAMVNDNNGNLWVATVDKGVVKVTKDGKVVDYTTGNSPLVSNGCLCMAFDAVQDLMYIGTSMGVSVYDCAHGNFVNIKQLEKVNGSYISSLLVNDRGILFVGSRNGLWTYRRGDDQVHHFTTYDGMSNNIVRALAKSGDYVWAATDNGLTCILAQMDDRRHFECKCYPFYSSDGLEDVVFSNNAALTTQNGEAWLGCFMGYVSIMNENIITQQPSLHVRFTDFMINGKLLNTDEDGGNTNLYSNNAITLHHDDHLGVAVSAMLPSQSRKIKYFYRFKGEKEWMGVSVNILHLLALKPGKHVLQVKAELPGMMESSIAELPIEVLPPFWLSIPAILAYIAILILAFCMLNRAVRQKQKRQLLIKQMEVNLKKYEMEEEKIRFFTNISHDLKTPLTLVMAPLEKIRAANLPANIKTEMEVAWRNAQQLYDLILQLLDFRRLDVGMEKLHLKHGDIVGFVSQTVQGFAYYAAHKEINLHLNVPKEPVEIVFDENKMRRIVTNLLSNAYKYNSDNGDVTVDLLVKGEEDNRQIVLSFSDTGIGVKDKQHVFDRFMQESHGHEQEGSGLGLHIVRQYVEMMGGTIDVTDNKPKGTVFTVTLPVMTEYDNQGELTEEVDSDDEIEADAKEQKEGKPTIMVVEDNLDARQFLQRSLEDEYHVIVAENGMEALEKMAGKQRVNIVVSDVMMPLMDGIQLFRQLKNNINYSHIPVILLTAKSGQEDIVASMKEGVADYITKPFSLAVLKLKIKKILEWTQNTYTKVGKGMEIKPNEITVSSLDEELITHVMESIETNMADTNYSVVQLSQDVGMTRGHLYKKLMAITGKTPLEFIRIMKMKRGRSLLDQGKTNISEVADMVGLSPKQFTNYFKQTYGEIPSEYLKKLKQ